MGGWPNYVLGNHDEHRIASRVGQHAARAAMMLLLTLRGTPTLYYGDEIGMHDVHIPPEREQDPWGKRMRSLNVGRDPERTPMQWDSSANAGFTSAGVRAWLPVADDFAQINAAAQRNDPRSMLSLTRQLIALRRITPALHSGSYCALDNVPDDCFVYLRQHDNQRWLVAINFSGSEQTLHLPELGMGHVALSTTLDREDEVDLSAFRLRGNEGCIIELR